MRYPIFIEKDENSDYGVTVPDLPGCFSAGESLDEAISNAREAILTHVEGMLMDDEAIITPSEIDVLKDKNSNPDYIWAVCEVDIAKLSRPARRINVTLSENVLSRIDGYAESVGETRSGFLAAAALEYISRHTGRG